jgi:NTP pyrophosphatase (non-canonical NTP hydrolase)
MNKVPDITEKEAKLAVKLWGEDRQYDVLVEEIGEFLAARNHWKRKKITYKQYVSELADVYIMLQQQMHIHRKMFNEVYPQKLQKIRNKLARRKPKKMIYKNTSNFCVVCILNFYKMFTPSFWAPKFKPPEKTYEKITIKSLKDFGPEANEFLDRCQCNLDNVKWIYHSEYVMASPEDVTELNEKYRILWNHNMPGTLFLEAK